MADESSLAGLELRGQFVQKEPLFLVVVARMAAEGLFSSQ